MSSRSISAEAVCVDVMDASSSTIPPSMSTTSRSSVGVGKRKRANNDEGLDKEHDEASGANAQATDYLREDRIDRPSAEEEAGGSDASDRGSATKKQRRAAAEEEEGVQQDAESSLMAVVEEAEDEIKKTGSSTSGVGEEDEDEENLAWERMWNRLTPTQKAVRFIFLNKQLQKEGNKQ